MHGRKEGRRMRERGRKDIFMFVCGRRRQGLIQHVAVAVFPWCKVGEGKKVGGLLWALSERRRRGRIHSYGAEDIITKLASSSSSLPPGMREHSGNLLTAPLAPSLFSPLPSPSPFFTVRHEEGDFSPLLPSSSPRTNDLLLLW